MVKEKEQTKDMKDVVKLKRKIAVIRIRGDVNVKPKIRDTLKMLRLYKKNRCVVIPSTPSYLGMLHRVKDYCTFGEIDEKTFAELLKKRGRLVGNKPLTAEYLKEKTKLSFEQFAALFMQDQITLKDIPALRPFFKLHPPVGGFERGGIKKPYSMHGALGYRKDAINKLIRRML